MGIWTGGRGRNMVKINIYKPMVKPVVVYGSETWSVTDGYEKNEYMDWW